MTAVLEYLAAELVELSGNVVREESDEKQINEVFDKSLNITDEESFQKYNTNIGHKDIIKSQHVKKAFDDDNELSMLDNNGVLKSDRYLWYYAYSGEGEVDISNYILDNHSDVLKTQVNIKEHNEELKNDHHHVSFKRRKILDNMIKQNKKTEDQIKAIDKKLSDIGVFKWDLVKQSTGNKSFDVELYCLLPKKDLEKIVGSKIIDTENFDEESLRRIHVNICSDVDDIQVCYDDVGCQDKNTTKVKIWKDIRKLTLDFIKE